MRDGYLAVNGSKQGNENAGFCENGEGMSWMSFCGFGKRG